MTQKSLVFAVPGKKGTYSTKNLSEEDIRRLLDANSKDEPMGDLKSFAKRMEATGVKRILRRIATSIVLVVSASAFADNHSPLFDTAVCAPDGVAVGGYDVVSYREDTGPVPGAPEFAHDHDGLTYRFANAENLNAFLRDSGKYLPMYRGWCSAVLAMGRLACPDYTNFKIENGDLLLFEIVGFTNGRDVWDSDPITNRRNADRHFRRLLGE